MCGIGIVFLIYLLPGGWLFGCVCSVKYLNFASLAPSFLVRVSTYCRTETETETDVVGLGR